MVVEFIVPSASESWGHPLGRLVTGVPRKKKSPAATIQAISATKTASAVTTNEGVQDMKRMRKGQPIA